MSVHIIKKRVNSQTWNVHYQSRRRGIIRMRGKQPVRKGIWYLGGRKRLRKRTQTRQRGGALPLGPIALLQHRLLVKLQNLYQKKFS